MKNNNSWPPKWVTPVTKKNLNKSRGKEISAFINSMCIQTKDTIAGRSGELLATRKWQDDLLNHIFAVNDDNSLKHRTALVGMARKNGKSALSSGIALWGLFLGENGGEVYSCAADKDQAKIVFNDAKKMIFSREF